LSGLLCNLRKKGEIDLQMRTDLALESEQKARVSGELAGVTKRERHSDEAGLGVTEIELITPEAAELIGRPVGRYVTLSLDSGRFSDRAGTMDAEIRVLAEELSKLIGGAGKVLIAGLGNTDITPDALGPKTASKVLATRHIKLLAKDIDSSMLSEVTVTAPGVMAQTGVEAQALIRALCREVGPDLVIAVDALACSELDHLGSTVQLCDTGISPGSGVENARAELSEKTLGVRCIAIGVPTVTDCSVIAEASGGSADGGHSGMIVTPRDIDLLISRTAGLISSAVNRALHPSLPPEELDTLI